MRRGLIPNSHTGGEAGSRLQQCGVRNLKVRYKARRNHGFSNARNRQVTDHHGRNRYPERVGRIERHAASVVKNIGWIPNSSAVTNAAALAAT